MNIAKQKIAFGSVQSNILISAVLLLLALTANFPVIRPEHVKAQAGTNVTTDKFIKPTGSPISDSAKMPADLVAIINSGSN